MALFENNASGRRSRRAWQLVGCLFGVVYGGWGMVQELGMRRQSAESLQWPGVSGQIITAARRHENGGRRTRACTWAQICFQYQVAGDPQTSCHATFLDSCYPPFADMMLARYPEGAAVTVFYDPRAPDQAVLEPGSWHGGEKIQIQVFLIVFCGAMFAFTAWRFLHPPEDDAAIGDPSDGPAQV